MGNRVLIQFVSGKDFSPAIYGHWFGEATPGMLVELRARMNDRLGDVSYTAARCVQEMCGADKGSHSFGIWNAKKVLTAKDSPGDAGVFLVDISQPIWRVKILDGSPHEYGTLPIAPGIDFVAVHEDAPA